MKTPHRIELIRSESVAQYDPVTDSYTEPESHGVIVPCLVNYITQAKAFEEYGSREEKILICRFMQEQKPFLKAKYNDKTYVPIEAIDAPIKGAVRLKEVQHG